MMSLISAAVARLKKSGGSASVGHVADGAGAVVRTVRDKLSDIFSRNDFGSVGDAISAAGYAPVIDPTTGKVFLSSDSAPLNYSNTRAGMVVQQRDAAAGAANELIPGAVFQFTASGNGTVNAGAELSQTIWQGLYAYMNKSGDGSAHCATGIGQLGATGPGGYNELGGFQAELTNTGSALGTISGVEMLLKDSPDGGATTYSTKMQAIVGRIAKHNPTIRKSHNFLASSEGTLPPTAILGGSTGGLAKWERGFDFQGLTFTSGQVGLAPNNTFMAWLNSAGAAKSVLGVSQLDNVVLAMTSDTTSIQLTTSGFEKRLEVTPDASDAVQIWVGGALKRIGVGPVDSGGAGYRNLIVPN